MILVVNDLLDTAELEFLRRLYGQLDTRSGSSTAGEQLASVKHNRELNLGSRAGELKNLVIEACNRQPFIGNALLPKVIGTPILSAYDPGMTYGHHIDSAFGEADGQRFRSDLSSTIFLDDPGAYEGGELEIETEYGERVFKLPAGDAVFYPTLFIHRVRPVTRGTRRACILWMESLVRDPMKRMVLFDIAQATSWFGREGVSERDIRDKLVKVRENLYRMWLES